MTPETLVASLQFSPASVLKSAKPSRPTTYPFLPRRAAALGSWRLLFVPTLVQEPGAPLAMERAIRPLSLAAMTLAPSDAQGIEYLVSGAIEGKGYGPTVTAIGGIVDLASSDRRTLTPAISPMSGVRNSMARKKRRNPRAFNTLPEVQVWPPSVVLMKKFVLSVYRCRNRCSHQQKRQTRGHWWCHYPERSNWNRCQWS